jgi:predicted enzyme related to lactoylglutathione lyase
MMMANKHGDWVWYELMTSDANGAQAFYGPLLNWKIANPASDGFDYREIQAADDGFVGGIMQITSEMVGAQPGWVGYIEVDSVDASIASIEGAGGKLCMPARDMPGVGRFAMMFDPQGAIFYVMTGEMEETSTAFAADAPNPGHCAWNELMTSDRVGAMAFYTSQFGWVKDGEMDMGPIGTYEMLRHGPLIGGMMTKMPEMPVSIWNFYFRVADIDAAIAMIGANGGTVINGPDEIPGGDFTINGIDPQGAYFALIGTKH